MRVDHHKRLAALGLDRPISLMTPEMIHQQSGGEVRKPETLNPRTKKAEKGGLFCDEIFGAIDAMDRFGHVDLGAPVRHPWLDDDTEITVIPVMPPGLRPIMKADVNDLYRRTINRNVRLKRLIELNAPDIIIENEKRLLQEAIDSLFDNENAAKSVSGPDGHKLVSIGAMPVSETMLRCLCFTT